MAILAHQRKAAPMIFPKRKTFDANVPANSRLAISKGTLAGILLLLLASSGCAGWRFKNPITTTPDVREKRLARRAELIKDFEQKRAQALLNAAQTRLSLGDESGAREALRQLLEMAPDHADGRLLNAELHVLNFELERARLDVEAVLAQQPQHPRALHALGLILDALGDAEEAAEYFGRAAELAPEDALLTLDYESTIDPRFSRVGAMPEKSPPKFDGTSRANDRESFADYPAEAFQSAQLLALEQAANTPRAAAMLRRAVHALRLGDRKLAIDQFQRAFEAEPQNERLARQVTLETLRANQPEVACAVLPAVLERWPQSSELYRLYGLSLYRHGQYDAAAPLCASDLFGQSRCSGYFIGSGIGPVRANRSIARSSCGRVSVGFLSFRSSAGPLRPCHARRVAHVVLADCRFATRV